eukprot:1006018-Prymnesium_polylepis.1
MLVRVPAAPASPRCLPGGAGGYFFCSPSPVNMYCCVLTEPILRTQLSGGQSRFGSGAVPTARLILRSGPIVMRELPPPRPPQSKFPNSSCMCYSTARLY